LSSFNISSVGSWVKKIFPNLRKTQSNNLSLGVLGMVKARSGLMSEIVREVPGALKHKHRLKRFWRFVSNSRVNTNSLKITWCSWVVKTFVPGKYIVVALDWTELPGNIQCLMAAMPFGGRAIPLLWVITTYRDYKDSQNRIEERLVTSLTQIIPREKKIILVADRGFGRASLINHLLGLNLLFCLRVKADVVITTQIQKIATNQTRKQKINLRQLKIKVGQVKWFKAISYRQDGIVKKVNLAVTLAAPKVGEESDPWLLVTNLRKASTAISHYQLRFDIEEWFKDLKHQLDISKLQTRNVDRVRRLVFISAVSYGLLMLIGSLTQRFKSIQDRLITGRGKAASRIWFALRIIEHQLLDPIYWRKIWTKAKGP